MRSIASTEFGTKRSLRFPRVMAIREDKSAASINTEAEMTAEFKRKKDLLAGEQMHCSQV